MPHVPPTFANGSLIANGLGTISGFFKLPAVLVALQNLIKQQEKSTFVSVGRLTYRREDGTLMVDMEAFRRAQAVQPAEIVASVGKKQLGRAPLFESLYQYVWLRRCLNWQSVSLTLRITLLPLPAFSSPKAGGSTQGKPAKGH